MSANKNDFRNGHCGLSVTMQVQPGVNCEAGEMVPYHKCQNPSLRPWPSFGTYLPTLSQQPKQAHPGGKLRVKGGGGGWSCDPEGPRVWALLNLPAAVPVSCSWTGNRLPQERKIAFCVCSLLWLAPYVCEEHFILLIVLVTCCKDYAC